MPCPIDSAAWLFYSFIRTLTVVKLDGLDNDDERCGICFEDYSACGSDIAVRLPCSHVLGRACLIQWLNPFGNAAKAQCPLCRRELYPPINLCEPCRTHSSAIYGESVFAEMLQLDHKNPTFFELTMTMTTRQPNKMLAMWRHCIDWQKEDSEKYGADAEAGQIDRFRLYALEIEHRAVEKEFADLKDQMKDLRQQLAEKTVIASRVERAERELRRTQQRLANLEEQQVQKQVKQLWRILELANVGEGQLHQLLSRLELINFERRQQQQ